MNIIESHSNGADALTKITFRLEESDWHSHATESMWASPAGANRFRLENTPFYIYGLSYQDVVSIATEEGLNFYQDVTERGGHSTYRIFLPKIISEKKFNEYWNALQTLGCSYEGSDYLIAVDVPPEADIYQAYEALVRGRSAEVWDFEEGHCGHPLNDFGS